MQGADRRAAIIEQGLELCSEKGVLGVTIGALAERTGMSKSGLFAHFRSKEVLQLELLRRAEALLTETVVAPAMTREPGLARLRRLMNGWLGWSQRAGLPGGCPLYAATFELDDLGGPLRDHLLATHDQWLRLLRGVVEETVSQGQLRADVDIDAFVLQLEGIYLSHHIAQRLDRRHDADRLAATALDALVVAAASTSHRPGQRN